MPARQRGGRDFAQCFDLFVAEVSPGAGGQVSQFHSSESHPLEFADLQANGFADTPHLSLLSLAEGQQQFRMAAEMAALFDCLGLQEFAAVKDAVKHLAPNSGSE